jgi:hypothetical protein
LSSSDNNKTKRSISNNTIVRDDNKSGGQWQLQKPQQQQHGDTHNANDDDGNKTVAIVKQLQWQWQWRQNVELYTCTYSKR